MLRCLLVATLLATPAAAPAESLEERARALHHDAIVVDGHNDAPMLMLGFGFDLGMDGAEAADRSPWPYFVLPWLPGRPEGDRLRTATDLARMRAGGLDAPFFSIWLAPDYYDPKQPGLATERALAMIEVVHAQTRRHADLELATTAADVRRIAGAGKHAALLGLEGGHAIEHDLATLRRYHQLGIRYMTLTHSFSHTWADSSGGFEPAEVRHGGLSAFGREVVAEMNRIGMVVDVSHVSDETFWQALEVTRAPVMASHSSARALVDHARNMDDAMLGAVAENGGVVMVNFFSMYIDPQKATPWRMLKTWVRHWGDAPTSLTLLVDHVDHVVQVAGIDHVGFGSDFDGAPFLPDDLDDVTDLPELTVELVRRGYSDEDVRKILGENVLRVLAEVERIAEQGDAGP